MHREGMGKREEIQDRLREMADASYKEFNDRLLKAPGMPTLGIRIPALRALARELAKEDEWMEDIQQDGGNCLFQEEHMLIGMTAGYKKAAKEEHAAMLDVWVPGIVSWADCDCGTSTLKWMARDPQFWFSYLEKWILSSREFEVRFAVIAMMDYFLTDAYIDKVLKYYETIRQTDYYVRMGIAWAAATAYLKYPEKVLALLKENRLDVWTHNKTIQKCRESRRISDADKEMLVRLRRRQEEMDEKQKI